MVVAEVFHQIRLVQKFIDILNTVWSCVCNTSTRDKCQVYRQEDLCIYPNMNIRIEHAKDYNETCGKLSQVSQVDFKMMA